MIGARSSFGERLPMAARFTRDRRRTSLFWALGVAAYCALIAAFFPSVRDSDSFSQILEDYPEPVRELLGDAALDLTSGPGFLHAEVFSIVGPLLLSIVAIGAGASLGNDERSGRLDLILANAVTRRRVVVERAVAMIIATAELSIVMLLTLAIADPLIESDVGVGPLALAVLSASIFALVFGAISLLVAAQTGDRSAAVGVSVLLFAATYLMSVASGFVTWLEPLGSLSPYDHLVVHSALFDRASPLGIASWTMAIGIATTVAAQRLERRDLG